MSAWGTMRRTLLPARSAGSLSWLAHRLTGIALALYLVPHFVSIHSALGGPAAFDRSLAALRGPIFKAAEYLLVGAVAFHLFNGLRIIAIDFLNVTGQQRLLLWLALAATAAVLAAASVLFLPGILGLP
jgi:succinate dehydrogenase / fumarate reductase cytochrome b subunit